MENFNGCLEEVTIDQQQEAMGFQVKNAMFSPREVKKGLWHKTILFLIMLG